MNGKKDDEKNTKTFEKHVMDRQKHFPKSLYEKLKARTNIVDFLQNIPFFVVFIFRRLIQCKFTIEFKL